MLVSSLDTYMLLLSAPVLELKCRCQYRDGTIYKGTRHWVLIKYVESVSLGSHGGLGYHQVGDLDHLVLRQHALAPCRVICRHDVHCHLPRYLV